MAHNCLIGFVGVFVMVFKHVNYKIKRTGLCFISFICLLSNIVIWAAPKKALQDRVAKIEIDKDNTPLGHYFNVKMSGFVCGRIDFTVNIKECYQKHSFYNDLHENCLNVIAQNLNITLCTLQKCLGDLLRLAERDVFKFVQTDRDFLNINKKVVNFFRQKKIYDNIEVLESMIQQFISDLNNCSIKLLKIIKSTSLRDEIESEILYILLNLKNIALPEQRAWNLSYNRFLKTQMNERVDNLKLCGVRYSLLSNPLFPPDVVCKADIGFAAKLKELLIAMQSFGQLLRDNIYLRSIFLGSAIVNDTDAQNFYWQHMMHKLCLGEPLSQNKKQCFKSIKFRLFKGDDLRSKDNFVYYDLGGIAADLTGYFEVFNIWACCYLQIEATKHEAPGANLANNYIDAYQRWLDEVKKNPASSVYQQVLSTRHSFVNPKFLHNPEEFKVLNCRQLDELVAELTNLFDAILVEKRQEERLTQAFLKTLQDPMISLQYDEADSRVNQSVKAWQELDSLIKEFEQDKKLLQQQAIEKACIKAKLEKTQNDLLLLLDTEHEFRVAIVVDAEAELNNLACSLQRRLIRALAFNVQQDDEDQRDEVIDEEGLMGEAVSNAIYSVAYSSEAEHDLEKIDRSVMARIEQQLSLDPLRDCHTVLGHIGNDTYRRIRCGDYRAIYCVKDEIVIIEGVFKRNFQTYGPRCLGRCVKKSLA